MRIKDEHIHCIQPPEGLDRGGPGVTRGRANDGDTVAAPRQGFLKHLPNQLHGKVFERQRGAMKQFQQEMP